jgi:hypothetical protein
MNLTDREMLARILGLVEGSGSIDKNKLIKEITDHLEKSTTVPTRTSMSKQQDSSVFGKSTPLGVFHNIINESRSK